MPNLPALRRPGPVLGLAIVAVGYWLYARAIQPQLDARTRARLRPASN